MIERIFYFQSSGIASATVLIALSALVSRGLGLFRDRLLAGRFGAGEELDVYFAAFRIPDFIFAVFVLGGVSAIFLPLFSEYMERNREEAWKFVSNLLHVLLLALGVLAGVLAIFAPQLMALVAPGFSGEQLELASSLTRLMLLSPILFGLSSVFSGVLHYFNRFLSYALAPVMYNLGIIGGIVFLAPTMGIWGVAWGVIAGAFLHVLIQLPAVFVSGFSWKAQLNFRERGVSRAVALALPRTIGGAAYQINLIVMTALASLLSAGSIAVFTFADNLQQAPVGLVGIPFALAAFPVLSKAFAQRQEGEFRQALLSTFRKIVLFVLPGALVLFLLREELIRIVYQTGAFQLGDAKLTAAVFGVFTAGILFQALIPLFVRSFFALQDTKTPTAAGVGAVVVNILLALGFLRLLAGAGELQILALPLALVISGFLQAAALGFLLWRKLENAFPPS